MGTSPAEAEAAPGKRPDLRLAAPALGVWLTAVVVLGTSATVALSTALAAALAGAGCLLARARTGWTAVVAATLVCSAAAAASVGLRLAAVAQGPLQDLATREAEVTLEVVVGGDPRTQPAEVHRSQLERQVIVRGRARVVSTDDGLVRVHSPVLIIGSGPGWTGLTPSQRIRVSGELGSPHSGELLSAVMFARGPPDVLREPSAVQRVAASIRAGLRAAVRPLPAAEQGLLPGLVVGDTSRMLPRVADDFRATGLAHLLAVSGTNVAIVLAAVLGAARLTGLGVRTAPLLAGLSVIGFAVLARPSPSVLRASVMGLITVVALASGRPRQGLPALCAATGGLVLFHPALARSYGFALSVVATAGLLVLMPVWRDRMSRRIPRGLAEALAVAAAAQVACVPLIVMMSGRVSVVAIPINLLVAPAVAPATVLGVLAAVAAVVWLPLAHVLARLGGLAAHWIVEVARFGAELPYATVPWPPGIAGGLAAVALLAVVALARAPLRRGVAVCLVGVLLATLTVRTVAPAWPPSGWLLVMCDVGQGDALALATGEHAAVVVDAGPDPRLADRCLTRLGVRRVPLLVLTHGHADHVAGVPGVLGDREVGAALVPPGPDHGPGLPVQAWLRRAGVTPRTAVTGQRWTVGSLRLTVLGPSARLRVPGGQEEAAINNASIVLRAAWPAATARGVSGPAGSRGVASRGVTALLTGDIEPEAQRALLGSAPLGADVLKVPHHGSASQEPALLAAVDPRAALIPVGAGNDYGHPSQRTLRKLRWLGARTYRTDRDGAVAIVRRDGRLAVRTRESRAVAAAQ